jgi:HAD superfamily hydrolase (TIGR01509 family)
MSSLPLLLCDADGTLFPSEEPAFEASAVVTNELMAELGDPRRFTAEELRRATSGRNFRSTSQRLAAQGGTKLDRMTLERWVGEERVRVTAHLRRCLLPDPRVARPLRRLVRHHTLAVVSSSASARVMACLAATGLDDLFPADRLFSAEDSLAAPQSKPSPAIYEHAAEILGVRGSEALAIEDAEPGVRSAVAAGFPVLGILLFTPPSERAERRATLLAAGAEAVVDSWTGVEQILRPLHAAALSR